MRRARAQRTVSVSGSEPTPIRPLSPVHWATKTVGPLIVNVAENEPPLAPAVTVRLVQRPAGRSAPRR